MQSLQRHGRWCAGFTLVELLVVFGIITLLIAILLPTLSRAREQANQVKCLATLRSMHQAALLHANEHQGYMQAAGRFTQTKLGIDSTPKGMGDPQMKRYLYYRTDREPRLMSLPCALAQYMGLKLWDDQQPGLVRFATQPNVRRLFQCASQDPAALVPGCTVLDEGDGDFTKVPMSYVFNDAFLGRVVHPYGRSPTGQLSRVRRPGDVFLFADGVGAPPSNATYAIFDISGPEETMYDNGRGRLDFPRHRGLFNAVFLDGHAASFHFPDGGGDKWDAYRGELDQVGVSKGIYD